jgi:hypothetical protein
MLHSLDADPRAAADAQRSMSFLESKAMPQGTSKFVKFIFGSRLAQFLFVVHLVLVVYAFAQKPRANPDAWGWSGCHGVPIADRVLYYCNETGLLKVLATLDFVGVVLFSIFATFFGWVWGPSISFHVGSWITAMVLLACTSFQWMLVGSCIERLLFRVVKNRRNV